MRVEVDFSLCESNGVCVSVAPDVFEHAEDNQLRLLRGEISDTSQTPVEEAVREWPRQAIFVAK